MKKMDILKVLVGSKAHKLDTSNSDSDYRGIFVIPTSELLKIGNEIIKHTSWIEGKEDDTSFEIGKFLLMSTKCNPTCLELFLSPIENTTEYGNEIRSLFPHIWNSDGVKNAFIGYGLNQRKKFFENKDSRAPKYATAYLRTLYNAWELLSTGSFSVDMSQTEIFEILKRFKSGIYTPGEVINECFKWETEVLKAYKANPNKQTNIEPVNEFLLKIRKEMWI